MVDVQFCQLTLVNADLMFFLGLYNPGLHFLPRAVWKGRLQGGEKRQRMEGGVVTSTPCPAYI
jgi:hypothetical protein